MTTTNPDLLQCACGCGQSSTQNRMIYVRSQWHLNGISKPGLLGWLVLKTCREQFEAELLRIHAAQVVVTDNAGRGFLRRLGVATQLYDLQRQIHERRKGAKAAGWIARQAVLLFLSPEWLRRWLPCRDVETQIPLDAQKKI